MNGTAGGGATAAAVARAATALRAGKPVLLPTDGVYGLCALADSEDAVLRLYRLKGRGDTRPTAIIAAGIPSLLDLVPELSDAERFVRELLPGPYTLVLPNPARRLPWLTGARPETIGVRVAVVPQQTQRVLDEVGAVAATSANDPGEPAAASLDEVPARIRSGCGAELDVGRLPGAASTVLDFTAAEPVVIREGAASGTEAIARVSGARRWAD